MRYLPLLLTSFLSLHSPLQARLWTSNDGRQLEAEFISANETEVKLRKEGDHKLISIPLGDLSEADLEWIAANKKPRSATDISSTLPDKIAKLVEEKGTLIFEDDFNREDPEGVEELGENWTTNSKSRAQGEKQNDLIDGALVMTISPKANHAISTRHTLKEHFKNGVVSARIRIPKDGSVKFAYNDRQHKAVHAGHINGITIRPDRITLADERSGRFNMKFRENKNTPEAKAAKKRSEKSFPISLKTDQWHHVITYHHDEMLSVYIDGEEVASFSSPGFGHETKRDFVFAVPRAASADDLKIWSLED